MSSCTPEIPYCFKTKALGARRTIVTCSMWQWFDGADVCELVGLFILHKLRSKHNNKIIGLYRDDRLAAFRNLGAPRTADRVRNQFIEGYSDQVMLIFPVGKLVLLVNTLLYHLHELCISLIEFRFTLMRFSKSALTNEGKTFL